MNENGMQNNKKEGEKDRFELDTILNNIFHFSFVKSKWNKKKEYKTKQKHIPSVCTPPLPNHTSTPTHRSHRSRFYYNRTNPLVPVQVLKQRLCKDDQYVFRFLCVFAGMYICVKLFFLFTFFFPLSLFSPLQHFVNLLTTAF